MRSSRWRIPAACTISAMTATPLISCTTTARRPKGSPGIFAIPGEHSRRSVRAAPWGGPSGRQKSGRLFAANSIRISLAGRNGARTPFLFIDTANERRFRPLAVPLYSFGANNAVSAILPDGPLRSLLLPGMRFTIAHTIYEMGDALCIRRWSQGNCSALVFCPEE